MKKIIITLGWLVMSVSLFAQTFNFSMQGDTLIASGNLIGYQADFKGLVKNLTSDTITTRWTVYDINFPNQSWYFYVCDDNLCYNAGVTTQIQTTNPEDTSLVKTIIFPANDKVGSLRVKVCDVNLPSSCEEFQLIVDATTSSHDLVDFVVLSQNRPNPFQNHTFIEYNLKGNTGEIIISDMLGRYVKTYNLNPQEEQLEIGKELNAGIYFYTLLIDGKLIATKRMQKL